MISSIMIPHKHLLVRAQISNPVLDIDQISKWISTLVDSIQMKILHGPVSVYCNKEGNRGITAFAIIETSHIVLHTWDEETPATLQLDVYTCSELEIDLVFNALSIFQPITLDYKFLDREQGFTDITESPDRIVEKWVSKISKKNSKLGGHRICPFAKTPRVISVDKLSIEKFSGIDDQITVYMENGVHSTYEELDELCRTLKSLNPNFVFLPDHPHKRNYINGEETGNGVFPCIIVQTKQELDTARLTLEKTDYYSYWDQSYLAEIKSFN
jgi:S-adenosylmethionine/arginine decarboxylase-like enzyme